MSAETLPQPPAALSASEDEIRDYAYHLYVQNGHRNDQCCDNWQEARACLKAGIAKSDSHTRLSKVQAGS